ncbi:MAG: sigma54 specific transcriptional regulator Fis family - like protein [bacterium]|nr:MAG: sigma54 specific transcriptional regulator Fis family - like protein [bacterium]KAF0148393.1 MAG: sigma54 specific transcriptional regulator Fis family - like protein [bacterium]KAF0166058.1 MAG: sigma54 specific transcriptional regulator Fis family - like protein [bacterium]TXT16536.1 MAG: sigma54 specific transcriptional regulator Fis family - like protein [bacterium]
MAARDPRKRVQLDPVLQSMVDTHPEAFALVDKDFVVVACNRKYSEIYAGADPVHVVGKTCHEITHKTSTNCELNGEDCPLTHVFETGQPFQVIHRHFDCLHDPDYVVIHASPILGADGKVAYMGESATSISHEEDLRFDEQKMVAGCCPSFMTLLQHLATVADTNSPVLIEGETGTGKELAARLIHRKSKRALKEFVPLDCTQFTEEMFASELFGHTRGAFTGAVETHRGLFEAADGGTLFLDEVGDMPLSIQARFLRVLETGNFRRLGESRMRRADVRIICATNRDLKQMVEAGSFRADLYYRIHCMQLELPPLRHRRDDIPELVEHFLGHGGKRAQAISPEALDALVRYDYPGNIRELRNILERAAILAHGATVELAHLPKEVVDPAQAPQTHPLHEEQAFFVMPCGTRALTPEAVRKALDKFHGNRRLAAQAMGVSERTLYRWLKAHPALS